MTARVSSLGGRSAEAPRMGRVVEKFLGERSPRFLKAVSDWEDPTRWSKTLKNLGYRFEKHNEERDPLCLAAEASIRSPLLTTSVNVTLAIRKALRRYLNIETPASPSISESKPKGQKSSDWNIVA
jgi:hypothetical protein